MWWPTRHGRVEHQDPPTASTSTHAAASLSSKETAAGRPHTTVVDGWGRVWHNDPARQSPPLQPLPLGELAGGGRRGARPPPPPHRHPVGRPTGAGRGPGHRPVAKRPPPRSPRPLSGPLARGSQRGRSPRRGMGARSPPAHTSFPPAACLRWTAASYHATPPPPPPPCAPTLGQ